MATKKKKQDVVEEIPVEQVQAEPTNVPPVVQQGECIQCRFILTGTWRGPICQQPASPHYKQRVRDADTCEMFQSNGRPQSGPVAARALPEPDVTTEGQYDPDPASLAELLDRETEAPKDGTE